MTDLATRDAEILRLTAEKVERGEIMRRLNVTRSIVDNVRKAAKRAGALAPVALPTVSIRPPDPVDRSGFAERIVAAWRESVLAILETGRLLSAAKEALPHGAFLEMVGHDLPFGPRTAQRLMAIAGDERLSDATHVSHLPASWGTLYELTKLDDATFEEKISDGTIRPDMERRDIEQTRKAKQRAVREELLGRTIAALPEKKYGVILCDDEWDFAVRSRETGMDRHAANHYETAAEAHTAEELHERTKARFLCAAADCALFMWATVPHLDVALKLMALRSFEYKSSCVWVKYKPGAGIGKGFWFRVDHELLLLGIRGNVPCPAAGEQWRSVFDVPATGVHSQKPDAPLEMIESYFPTLPKIELNRRGAPRPGWDAWGNEVEESTCLGSSGDAASEGQTPTGPDSSSSSAQEQGSCGETIQRLQSSSLESRTPISSSTDSECRSGAGASLSRSKDEGSGVGPDAANRGQSNLQAVTAGETAPSFDDLARFEDDGGAIPLSRPSADADGHPPPEAGEGTARDQIPAFLRRAAA